MSRRVLVTGAGGFVGRALLPVLAGGGWEAVGALRCPAGTAGVEARIVGDIGPDTDWRAALQGVDAVVHLAARVHVMRDAAADPLAEFRRINTAGTRRLAEQAAAAGVRRLVYLSSVKVNGEATDGRPFREADPPQPRDPYGISKMEAERALAEVAAATGLETVVLRPPLVYGPGVKGNFRSLMDLVRRRLPLPFGAVANTRSLIGLANLAGAIALCLDHPAAANRVFLLRDGEDVSTPELVRRLAHALGVPPRLVPVPAAALRLAGQLVGRAAAVERLLGSLAVDDAAIRRDLGWRPAASLDSGLAEAVAWHPGRS